MDYKVIKKDTVYSSGKNIEDKIKTSKLLSGDWSDNHAVATVLVNQVKPAAEVHQKAVDVFQVLEGKGKIILGGKLKNPKKVAECEFVGEAIENGDEYNIEVGDIIDIPAGIPHQFDVRNGRLELLIIKINLKQ